MCSNICSKKVSILKSPCIVFAESGKMGNQLIQFQSKKPAVCIVHFYIFYSLTHAFDPIEILDKRYLYESNRIDARSSVIMGIFISDKVIDE